MPDDEGLREEAREQIARALQQIEFARDTPEEAADAILAVPAVAEALAALNIPVRHTLDGER